MAQNDWMKNFIGDDQHLSEITMPGSHDAGVYEDAAESTGLSGTSNTVCQSAGLLDQCNNGSRFFDIRVMTHSGAIVAHHSTSVLGMRHGAFGGGLASMLNELKGFVSMNRSEFVIVRFSKCKDHENVVNEVKEFCGPYLFKTAAVNIAHQKIGQLRGKIVTVFADDFRQQIDPPEGLHAFQKYDGGGARFGLTTCGSYANKVDMVKVYKDQLEKVCEHDKHANRWDHLHVMYWTQTSGIRNIKDFTTAPTSTNLTPNVIPVNAGGGGSHAFAGHMTEFLADRIERNTQGVARPSLPNVIMYDFVNEETSASIIQLNSSALSLS